MRRVLASLYDPFMARTERRVLQTWRQQTLLTAHGDTLELGAGTGANLGLYPAGVTRLTLVEPDAHMRRRLEARLRETQETASAVVDARVDALPFSSASFDTVVATLLLCSVPKPAAVLDEVRRVLRPGGRFLFIEHVIAEGYPARARLQRWVDPLWCRLAGGCHVTRDTKASLVAAGFYFEDFTRQAMVPALPFLRPSIRGVAIPA